MTTVPNLEDVIALHNALRKIPFKCGDHSPKICIVDHQKDGYVIAVKKRCCLRCIRKFLEKLNLSVKEDEDYLTISSK
jgi:hypothetical protein